MYSIEGDVLCLVICLRDDRDSSVCMMDGREDMWVWYCVTRGPS